jgi:hypothetical protein
MKRPRNSGVLTIWQIPGLLTLIYSFLIAKRDVFETKDNTFIYLDNGEPSSLQISRDRDYFTLREICKTCQQLAHYCDGFLNPHIKSLENLEKWAHFMPKLQSIIFPNPTSVVSFISFSHLRTLQFYDNGNIDYDANICFNKWNCPLLTHLEMFSTCLTEFSMEQIALHFPILQKLRVIISLHSNFKIENFPNLQKLSLGIIVPDRNQHLHIHNLPILTKLNIGYGLFDSLKFSMTPNLQKISSIHGFNIKCIAFDDDVPLLNDVHFGYDKQLQMNSLSYVNWKNVKHLHFCPSVVWDDILSRLVSLETLDVTQSIYEPNIQWSKLHNLTSVKWRWPSFDVLSLIASSHLKHFYLEWKDEHPIFDFSGLLKFPNLEKITLVSYDGKYVNFESILQLPKHVKINLNMRNLTESEELLIIDQRNVFNFFHD